MGSVVHQVWNFEPIKGLEKEDDGWCHEEHKKRRFHKRRSTVSPTRPDSRCKAHNQRVLPPFVGEGRVLAVSTHAEVEEIENDQTNLCSDSAANFVALLRACAQKKDLNRGTKIHDDIAARGLLPKCSDALATMYARCDVVAEAKALLDKHKSRSVFAWNAVIAGYVRQGQAHDAFACFKQMEREGLSPNAGTFACILKACGRIGAGDKAEQVHNEIARRGLLGDDLVLGNALVDTYAKCGALAKAQQVLEELPFRNVFCWSSLITGHVQHGQGEQALTCFDRMLHEGISPNAVTYTCILKACGNLKALDRGKQVHDEISRHGLLGNDVILGNALEDMYVKCGALTDARQVLKELPRRTVISWNTLISGYAEQGQGEEALSCLEQMKSDGFSPDTSTFIGILKACGSIRVADKGIEVHDEIVRRGLLGINIRLGTALVDMYVKCGALEKARGVFEELPSRDVVAWSALIAGYAQHGQGKQALECAERMQREGLSPDAVTLACILKACGSIGAADKGECFFDQLAGQGLWQNDLMLGTSLVDMYAKCGQLAKARRVLEELSSRDVVAWTALIAGYTEEGEVEKALVCLKQMRDEGLSPDAGSLACILRACSSTEAADEGEQLYNEIVSLWGMLEHDPVLNTALVDMYAKCGALAKACQVLNKLSLRDVGTWSAVIAGYVQEGCVDEALACYEKMQQEKISPDAATLACILKACGNIGADGKGQRMYDEFLSKGSIVANQPVVCNALVGMYVQCGTLSKAQSVFHTFPCHDAISWNTLLSGYAQQGLGEEALDLFEQMQSEGIFPDAVTFSSLLNACSQLGLVEDGYRHFISISTRYGMKPDIEHYTCMLNLLGRAGQLEKAVGVIRDMAYSGDSAVWSTLLGACRRWGDVQIGGWAFEQAVQVDTENTAPYVLLASIHTGALMQENATHMESFYYGDRNWYRKATVGVG